jgi:Family of unknown function (DUF6157)
MTTNYVNTLITPSTDCKSKHGEAPAKEGSIATLQYALLRDHPYAKTSDDVLFEVHAQRKKVAPENYRQERETFFSKPQACLRASPLVKTYGWGIHHDENGKVALVSADTKTYAELVSNKLVKVVPGMRSSKVAKA